MTSHLRSVSAQNERGEWVPAIPLPFYGLRKRCTCGRAFWTERRYREHYAYEHIVIGRDTHSASVHRGTAPGAGRYP